MHSLSATLAALALLAAPNAETVDCGSVAERYAASLAKVMEAIDTYRKCVSSSDKQNNCAAQIEALDNAHDEFADAVGDAKDCKSPPNQQRPQ